KSRTIVEGFVSVDTSTPSGRFAFPRLWEALGARAALRRGSDGYVVEMAVPREALGSGDPGAPDAYKLNVRVFHNDGKRPWAPALGWSADPLSSSGDSDEFYTSVRFTSREPSSGVPPGADD